MVLDRNRYKSMSSLLGKDLLFLVDRDRLMQHDKLCQDLHILQLIEYSTVQTLDVLNKTVLHLVAASKSHPTSSLQYTLQ